MDQYYGYLNNAIVSPWQYHGNQFYDMDLTANDAGPQQSRKPTNTENPSMTAPPTAAAAPPQFPSYNPQLLLNPKSVAAQTMFRGGTPANPQSFTANHGSPNDVDENLGYGAGSFIERMHNVQEREHSTASAPKRKRIDDEEPDGDQDPTVKPKSSLSSSIRSGGTLGEHLKKEREQIAAEAGPANMAIDLTKDDDDIQVITEKVIAESGNDEICLGMIQAKVNVHRLPAVSVRSMSLLGNSHWPRAKVDLKRPSTVNNVIDLYDRTGQKFGKLDPNTSLALCPLLDRTEMTKLRVAVWLDQRPRKKDEVAGAAVSIYLPVSIILYARRASSEKIGRWLSQKNIFLSPPFNANASHREYQNPQLPKDYSASGLGQSRSQQVSAVSTMTRTIEEMRREAGNMIDSLVQHEDLPEMEADERYIATPLLAHQKQGLHFLTDHERADHDSGFSLWKRNQKNNGGEIWYNVITGHELNEKPEPVQGGILADMMGLGKTLSILSLIAATRVEAAEFGKAASAEDDDRCHAKATLIICPKSVMSNWHEQIRAHTKPNTFKVYAYHGSTRTQSTEELAKYHIVLTTYNTAAAELTGKNRALASMHWFRIVLDEAHQIRNQSTQVSKACCALLAQRRWAVTGTPVQNALNDLGALIKFLRIRPFDQGQAWAQSIIAPFRMANTDVIQHLRLLVDSITLRRLKDNIDLTKRTETRVRLDFTDDEGSIYARVAGNSGKQLRLMTGTDARLKGRSYAHVLKSIGRMRMLCAHGLDMLNEDDRKEVLEGMDPNNAIAIDLGDEPDRGEYKFVTDRQAYEILHMMSDSDVNRCIKCDRTIGEKEEQETEEADDTESSSSSSSSSEDESSTGITNDITGYLTPCYHLVCPDCKSAHDATIEPLLTVDKRYTCQYCETYIRHGTFELHRSAFLDFINARNAKVKKSKDRRWDESNYSGPSTKVKALIEDLKKSLEETKKLPPGQPPIRSVVFSGWTTYLSLIEVALEENGIGYVRLDGSMSIRARTSVLDQFKTDPDIVVLLVSIKAGGQGLNFTAANKVYMMEPQFNPGTEQQAIDRVHRLGQTRDVFITYYIMNKSVEEGILKLQDKKEKLANLSLNRKLSPAEVQKQKLEDLRELFK